MTSVHTADKANRVWCAKIEIQPSRGEHIFKEQHSSSNFEEKLNSNPLSVEHCSGKRELKS